jgi:hypothetical protein
MFSLQRRDYEFSDVEANFPVKNQASHIDDVPIHNIAMEQYCGKISHRLDSLKTVEACSRSHILQMTQKFVSEKARSFRTYSEELEKIELLKLDWSQK